VTLRRKSHDSLTR